MAAPLVFAGYGVTADEFHYDDYAGLDVKDKIVVVLRYEPSGFAEKSGNHGLTQHSQLITKAINAHNHGAKAIVVLNGKLGDGEEDLLTRFGSVSGPENVGLVMVQVKNAVAEPWFQSSGKSLKDVQDQINSATKPASFAFPDTLHLSLHIDIETTRATVNNVLAWLPGQTDEYVIIGAHYDHLGRGNFDSLAPSQIGQIHPGADDNASGTAGVLELARLLAPQRGQLKRSILFMDFAGEELGLLGSAAWVQNPTRPLAKAVAMINMDMIGRIKDDKVYIGGVGTGSTFKAVLEQAQKDAPFKIEYSAERIFFERPHFVCDQEDSVVVLLFWVALRLSQAVRHMGQDQRPLGRAAARHGRRVWPCNWRTRPMPLHFRSWPKTSQPLAVEVAATVPTSDRFLTLGKRKTA